MVFNFIPVTLDDEIKTEELPEFIELARNNDNLELLVKDNKFYTVSKNEALKIWILKALNKETSRYEHRAYTPNYGNEIKTLFGRNLKGTLLKSELKRYVQEALLVNPYIKNIENFTFEKKGSKVSANFIVITVYGEFEQNIDYNLE